MLFATTTAIALQRYIPVMRQSEPPTINLVNAITDRVWKVSADDLEQKPVAETSKDNYKPVYRKVLTQSTNNEPQLDIERIT